MRFVTLQLRESVINGAGVIGYITQLALETWRRSIRRVGGYWIGTFEVTAEQAGQAWLDEMFTYGLLREVREIAGGEETWRGAVAKMEYTRGGDVFVRDVTGMANAIRSIYTLIGDNLLSNGSGESGAWTAYNGATVTQDATWSSHGAYSIKVVVADTTVRGATAQSGITIEAGKQYLLRATMKVTSGSWRLAVNRSDTNASLAFFSTSGKTGDIAVDVSIPDSNTYAGTVYVQITSEAAAGTINVDAAVLQLGPLRAETGWYVDAAAVSVYGRREEVLQRSGKSNADANAECQGVLLDRAWVNPQPPRNAQTYVKQARGDVLKVTVTGYWAMLNWLYTTLHGTKTCSEWVAALAALQSTYVSAGVIESNSMTFYVDDRTPLKVGDLLRDVAEAGETGGAKYAIGVTGARQLNYEKVSQALMYLRRSGKLYNVSGGEVEPWLARPGWTLWQDMPVGAGTPTGNAQHDPRWVFLEEVEMLPPSADAPNGSIAFRLDAK